MENNSKLNIKEFLDKDEQKDLLRFLTAGSVDDGKSTLIGRLLFDSKKLYEDHPAAMRNQCDHRHFPYAYYHVPMHLTGLHTISCYQTTNARST